MKRIILLASLVLLALARHADAQTTVVIVTKVCNSNSGVQQCSYVPVDGSNPLEVVNSSSSTPLTPIAPPGGNLTLTTGGTSQQLLSTVGCPNFITVSNGQTTADQGGIAAAEPAYYNPTGNAASATPGGQSIPIYPGVKTSIVAQAGTAITWVAATTGHQLTAVCE